jgi:hypothetical protein
LVPAEATNRAACLLREQRTSSPQRRVARTAPRSSVARSTSTRSIAEPYTARAFGICSVAPRPGLAPDAHSTTRSQRRASKARPPSPPAPTVRYFCLVIPNGIARGGDARTTSDRPHHPKDLCTCPSLRLPCPGRAARGTPSDSACRGKAALALLGAVTSALTSGSLRLFLRPLQPSPVCSRWAGSSALCTPVLWVSLRAVGAGFTDVEWPDR